MNVLFALLAIVNIELKEIRFGTQLPSNIDDILFILFYIPMLMPNTYSYISTYRCQPYFLSECEMSRKCCFSSAYTRQRYMFQYGISPQK